MSGPIVIKRHDTRPIRTLTVVEQDPAAAVGVSRPVDLTNATQAKLVGLSTSPTILAFTNRTLGVVTWTPTAGETATAGTFQMEIEITWSDGGIETYPNDGYFTITIFPDLG